MTTGAAAATPRLETFTEWLRASRKAREAALQPQVERVRAMDVSIQAWVQVLPQTPTGNGTLSGIPFGVKDIIETKGLATEYGSPIYKGRIGTADAGIVRQLRQRGGVLLGKTQCAAFAYRTPPPTHNPRDLAHTPGGSSSGSRRRRGGRDGPCRSWNSNHRIRAATGFLLRRDGIQGKLRPSPDGWRASLAKSLDTLGFFTHTAADMLALWESLGYSTARTEDFALAAPDPMPDVEPAMAAAFQDALARLRTAGVSIRSIDIADMLTRLTDAATTIEFYEAARFHEQRFKEYGSRLADLADLVRDGLQMPVARYDEAMRYVAECKTRVAELYKATPVILVPAAPGPAPLGLASTGDGRMNAPWTALGTPAISIPMPVANGLPLGLQLTADHGQDARLIRTAVRVQRLLGSGTSG